MSNKTLIILAIVALAVFGYAVYYQNPAQTGEPLGTSNQNTPPPAPQSMVNVYFPFPNELVTSPLTVAGEARGNWYFEATFPVKLYDANSNLLAEGYAEAMSDWMTTDYVSFTANLTFVTPSTSTGTLVLEKDNPSGLPENADSVSIPVSF